MRPMVEGRGDDFCHSCRSLPRRPRTRRHEMTRYRSTLDDGAMTFPAEDLPDVARAAHAVAKEAEEASVWVFGAGLTSKDDVSVVDTDGTVTHGPENKAYVGG